MSIFRKKYFDLTKSKNNSNNFKKSFNAFDLVLLGLGAIIGTGVFSLTGMVAAQHSGPAVTISYIIAGIVCMLVALAYTELAVMIPTSGSIYTYSYVALGEIFAWIMGSVIILELTFGAATVAASWSAYTQGILEAGGIIIPKTYATTPFEGGIINLPAVLIVAFVSFVLYLGTRDSKRLNVILVIIKLLSVGIFIIVSAPHFQSKNWDNFMPFKLNSTLVGASILFFAFTGFSVLATAAEECKNPTKDLTVGIIGSLVISTIVYVIIAGLLTGIAPFDQLDNAQPLAYALKLNGSTIGSAIVAVGAVSGMTTVLMLNIYGQSRIFFAIARDGLLPGIFQKVHPKYDSPYVAILFFSLVVALIGGFFPYQTIAQLSSMGALIDYIVVSIIVMLLRIKMPDAVRTFKCPAVFVIAPVSVVSCIYLLFKQILDEHGNLLDTGRIIIVWILIVLVLYFIFYYIKQNCQTSVCQSQNNELNK
ncbi:amino acid permease family protein [Orientia chuto str. Dubai]|uniref:Amino acid permease family protein n=1 Tax=Orientia chuto str. Dubai TaxID=1359168 RepID=A0A0F3MME0_9RICK|nr:amino acid permease [Candidatus Orientia mediorientalis]KJV56910.1 amino acid permease family protein [Orientia chuto str. Dubai]